MNRDIGCTIIDFSTRLAERQAEKDRQNEIRLRMKYGDFRYEIAEEVADRHSRTAGPAPEVEEILKMMEMTGW
jgi:hypothetical protein